jgi:hypothetical protein
MTKLTLRKSGLQIAQPTTARRAANLKGIAKILYFEPPSANVRQYNNKKYLPISYVEATLDSLFGVFGWQVKVLKTETIANEYIVTGHLSVKNPETGEWIERAGIGAEAIEQAKGAAVTDISAKNKTALEKNAPSALASMIKNAAKKFGNLLGRNLSREEKGGYDETLADAMELLQDEGKALEIIANELKFIDTVDALSAHFNKLAPLYKADNAFVALFTNRKNEINNASKV